MTDNKDVDEALEIYIKTIGLRASQFGNSISEDAARTCVGRLVSMKGGCHWVNSKGELIDEEHPITFTKLMVIGYSVDHDFLPNGLECTSISLHTSDGMAYRIPVGARIEFLTPKGALSKDPA